MVSNNQLINDTDENLLQKYSLDKDKEALEVLLARHMTSAYHLAFKYMKNQADAEDVVQKAFVRIMRFSRDQNQPGLVKAWIMKTVINTSKSEIRDLVRHRRRVHAKPILEATQPTQSLDILDDANELRKKLLRAIDQLPEHFRLPIWLTHYENMSVREVSVALDRPEQTVRTQISRGLEKLQNALKNYESQFTAVTIIAILSECKKIDKVPISLHEKINSLSSIKISTRIATNLVSKKSIFVSMILPFTCLLILAFLSFQWWSYMEDKENLISSGMTTIINNPNLKAATTPSLDLFCDFESKELPIWITVVSGEVLLSKDKDKYGKYLKFDSNNEFKLKLNIPKQNKPFKVSFDIKPKVRGGTKYAIFGLSESFNIAANFLIQGINLNFTNWNQFEIIIQKNTQAIFVNKRLILVAITKEDYPDPAFIKLKNLFGRLDNVLIQSIDEKETGEYSKCIEISNQYKGNEPFKMDIDSPLPNITKEKVIVQWTNEFFSKE